MIVVKKPVHESEAPVFRKTLILSSDTGFFHELVTTFVANEIEVGIFDPSLLPRSLSQIPHAIVLYDLDSSTGELAASLDDMANLVSSDTVAKGVDVGYFYSAKSRSEIQRLSLDSLKLLGGIDKELGVEGVFEALSQTLTAVIPKGPRRFLRVPIGLENVFTLPVRGQEIPAKMIDISSAGFSCVLAHDPGVEAHTHFQDVPFCLANSCIELSFFLMGSRPGVGETQHVFVFQTPMADDKREFLAEYISTKIQETITNRLQAG